MGETAPRKLPSEEPDLLPSEPAVDTLPKEHILTKYGTYVDVPGGNGDLAPVDDRGLDI
jgi:hypothetical protein